MACPTQNVPELGHPASREGRCNRKFTATWARVATRQDWQRDADAAGGPAAPAMRDTVCRKGPGPPADRGRILLRFRAAWKSVLGGGKERVR